MKKYALLALMLFSTISFAQILDFKNTRFGATAGLNYSRVRYAHNPSGPNYTFQAGFVALIPVGRNDKYYIQPEITYYGAGETGKDSKAKNTDGYNAVYANNYISVPLYFKGYFSEDESEFFGVFGPRFNFLISQSVTGYPVSRPYYAVEGSPAFPGVNGKAASFAFALSGGIGYSYKRKLELALKADYGLTNVYPGLDNEPGSDPNIKLGKKEHVISLGLTYIFK